MVPSRIIVLRVFRRVAARRPCPGAVFDGFRVSPIRHGKQKGANSSMVTSGYVNSLLLKMAMYSEFSHEKW